MWLHNPYILEAIMEAIYNRVHTEKLFMNFPIKKIFIQIETERFTTAMDRYYIHLR